MNDFWAMTANILWKSVYKLKYNSDKTKMEGTSQGYTNDSISNITDMK